MERVRRCTGHGLPEVEILSAPTRLTPQYLREWGRHAPGSPLYHHLVEVIADDPELMRVLNLIKHLPKPNLLFAAVQYLLADHIDSKLAGFYPSLVENALPPEGSGPAFRDYVLDQEEAIVEIGRTRRTQTNECRRCVALLPLVWMSGFDRFHLIDLGTSAGLNLALDHYSYQWGELRWGSGAVHLKTELRGAPPFRRAIDIISRVGLDMDPIDPTSDDDRRWLDALIWPEHGERRERLTQALETVRSLEIDLIAGDAAETLEVALDRLPDGSPVVVMRSFVRSQLTETQRDIIDGVCAAARTTRPLFRVSVEFELPSEEGALLSVDDGTGWMNVGWAHHHGDWLDLLDDQALP